LWLFGVLLESSQVIEDLDNWIVNYEASQRQKHSQFLKEIKHEFIERTKQQRRDRLDLINQGQIQRVLLQTSSRRGRTAASDTRKA